MSLQELEAAVEHLSPEEYTEFLTWVKRREMPERPGWNDAGAQERQPGEGREQRRERQLAAILGKGEEEFGPLVGERRPAGLFAGQIRLPADFDAPLPEETQREFEGG